MHSSPIFGDKYSVIWTEQPIFFLDFEGNQSSGVLEYGVAEVRRGKIGRTQTRLCQAIGRIREEDRAVHGLSEEELSPWSPFSDEWEFFATLRERGPLAAHYSGVENALVKSVWPYPRNSPNFARPGERVIDWGPWIDTARIFSQLYPDIGSGQLETLITTCGLREELDALAAERCPPKRRVFHSALYDALAGALLLVWLARDPRIANLTVMQMLALSTLDPQKREALQQGELF